LLNALDTNILRVSAVIGNVQPTLRTVENILLSASAFDIVKEDGTISLTVHVSSDRLCSCKIKMYNDVEYQNDTNRRAKK
jgi:hypothetical protein